MGIIKRLFVQHQIDQEQGDFGPWRSQCCGKPPHIATDVTEDNPVGVCCLCLEWTGFEKDAPDELEVK